MGCGPDLVEDMCKQLRSNSERELGAYVATYAAFFKEVPAMPSSNQREFRNKVIHQGKIPTRDEANSYGQGIMDCIRPSLLKLKEGAAGGMGVVFVERIKSYREHLEEGEKIVTQTIPSVLGSFAFPPDSGLENPPLDDRPLQEIVDSTMTMADAFDYLKGPDE